MTFYSRKLMAIDGERRPASVTVLSLQPRSPICHPDRRRGTCSAPFGRPTFPVLTPLSHPKITRELIRIRQDLARRRPDFTPWLHRARNRHAWSHAEASASSRDPRSLFQQETLDIFSESAWSQEDGSVVQAVQRLVLRGGQSLNEPFCSAVKECLAPATD